MYGMNYEKFQEGDRFFEAMAVSSVVYPGIAIRALGWATEPCRGLGAGNDGLSFRNGSIATIMVGDDRVFSSDPGDLTVLARADYCGECGQVGCHCDGYDRE